MASVLQIGFLGVEEGSDPKAQPPGTLLSAVNCKMDKDRRLGKRDGTTGLAKTVVSGGAIAAGARLLTDGRITAMTDGDGVYSRSETNGTWALLDREPPFSVLRRPHVDTSRSVTSIDTAIYGDFIVTHFCTGSFAAGTFFQVDQLSTGQNIYPPTLAFSGVSVGQPKVVMNGSVAIFLAVSGAGVLSAFSFDLATGLAVATNASVLSSVSPSPVMDAIAVAGKVYITCAGTTGNRANLLFIDAATLATGTAIVEPPNSALNAVSIAYDAAANLLTWLYSPAAGGVTCVRLSLALGITVGPTALAAPASGVITDNLWSIEKDATHFIIGWTVGSGGGVNPQVVTNLWDSLLAVVSQTQRITFNAAAASKPWVQGGRFFIGLATQGQESPTTPISNADKRAQPSTVVVEIETANSATGVSNATHPHVATMEDYTGAFVFAQTRAQQDAAGSFWLVSPTRDREYQNMVDQVPIGWNIYKLTLGTGDWSRGAMLAGAELLASGAPAWFDGETCMPYGFAQQPSFVTGTTSTTTGSMLAGVYSYVATYAWRDAHGILHRSAPSPPVSITTTGTTSIVSLTISTSSVSAKVRKLALASTANPILVELWRTTVGGTSNHYLLTQQPVQALMVLNDPRALTVSYVDKVADSNISPAASVALALSAQAQLYTDIGELPNLPPPAFTTCATNRNRLVGIGPDERTIWFSKDYTEDLTLAPGFNAALTETFSRRKVALASMDSTLVVFGEDHIDVVSGDGPDDTGANGTWAVDGVQTDLGCINPRSVVVFQDGVLFLSRVGFALLDRQRNVTWFSKSVDDTLDRYSNITSAVLVSEETEIRWTCDDGSTGIVLVYDYQMKIWFTRKYTDASDTSAASVRFVDAALINGVYTLLTAAGQVYRETGAHCLDGGTAYVERDVLLAPISAQPGRSGWSNNNLMWSRVKDVTLMGTSLTNHNLEVSAAHDYGSLTQVHTFLAGDAVTSPGPLEKARVTFVRQKCQAVQIRIRDLTPTAYPVGSSGAGFILEALALRVAAIDGPARTADTQRA